MGLLTAGLLACLALLTGCGHGEPNAGPTTHATSSAPGETPPTYPARAEPSDVQGAANFVDYYIKLLDYAEHTGDTDELEKYSSNACEGCWNYIRLYQELYAAGGYERGSRRSFKTLRPVQNPKDKSVVTCYLTLAHTGGEYRASKSSKVLHPKSSSNDVGVVVQRDGAAWIVTKYGLTEQAQ